MDVYVTQASSLSATRMVELRGLSRFNFLELLNPVLIRPFQNFPTPLNDLTCDDDRSRKPEQDLRHDPGDR
jgi:hypothetical protein